MASARDEIQGTAASADRENQIEFPGATRLDSIELLADVGAQLEAVHRDPGLRVVEFIDMVEAADWHGIALLKELEGEFLSRAKEAQSEEQLRAWDAIALYLARVEASYLFLVRLFQTYSRGWAEVGDRLPQVIARALRASASRMKWMCMRYRPIEPDIWKNLSQLWSYVEDKGLARARVLVYEDRSTLLREFTKPLMFAMSSVDSLPSVEIDLVDRLISHVAGRFEMQRYPANNCYFVLDIDQWTAPARYRPGGTVRLGSRFFGPGQAIADLDTISAQLAGGEITTGDVNAPGVTNVELVIDVLAHLERHWSPRRPERRDLRLDSASRMAVVLGYEPIVERIAGNAAGTPIDESGVETWGVANESEAGYGALVPTERGDRLHIGELVGVLLRGSRMWGVGVIRRLADEDAARRYVGIELLGRGVQAVRLSDPKTGQGFGTGLLLPSHVGDSVGHGEINLLLARGSFSPEHALDMLVYDVTYLLVPLMVLESGDNFEVGRYRILEREA